MTSHIKKPKSNFLIFYDEHRSSIKAQHPEMKMTDITRECSKQWSALTDAQRQVYTDKYNKEKEIYAAKVQALADGSLPAEQAGGSASGKETSKKSAKGKKDEEAVKEKKPRAPVSNGYINFCGAVRAGVKAENSSLGPKDIMKKIGEMWNKLSLEEKESYKQTGAEKAKDASHESAVAEPPKQEKADTVKKTTRKPRKVAAEPELA